VEEPDRVASPTHARDQKIGQGPRDHLDLPPRLAADDGLEIADHGGIGMRAQHRAQEIVRRADRSGPVAHGLVDRVLERAAAGGDRDDLGAEELHPLHVRALPLHVDLAHVDAALKPDARAGGCGRDSVLPRARLRDDAGLPHPPREERLADGVVDLVRARVEEILALEINAPEPDCLAEAHGVRERRRPPRERGELAL